MCGDPERFSLPSANTATSAAATPTVIHTATPLPPVPTPTATPLTPTPFALPPQQTTVPGRPRWTPALLETIEGHGDRSRPVVYLTFDDGWGYPDDILRVLQQRRARATACLVGTFMRQRPDFVRRWLEAGYSLCNHTYSHARLVARTPPGGMPPDPDLLAARVRDELTAAEVVLRQLSNRATFVPFFRPPYGTQDNVVRHAAAMLGYRTILWSLDPKDWRPRLDPAALRDYIVNSARNGDIIDLHFERRSTVEALSFIIDGLRARGFEILGLESLPSDQ